MQRYMSRFLEHVLSPEGRRTLKVSGIIAAIIIAGALGSWAYVASVQKTASKNFVHGQDLYLQAIGLEDIDKQADSLQQAIGLFQSAIDQPLWNTNRPEALLYLADASYVLKQYQQAIATLLTFQDKYPHNQMIPWAKLKIAFSYELLTEYDSALAQYALITTSYATSPVAPEALLGEARCEELTGDTEAAMETYENLVSRYPLSNQARLAQAKLGYHH